MPAEAPAPSEPEADRLQASVSTGTEIERFCSNIADAARDRRYALQAKELATLQQEVDKRIKLLEEKRAEYESWLKRRETSWPGPRTASSRSTPACGRTRPPSGSPSST